jgi:Family of unknown function (DUF6758)
MQPHLTVVEPVAAVVGDALARVPAPVWSPWPLPPGWRFTGCAYAGADQPESACAVSSWNGLDLFGDPAELVLVCEEAGAGVGSAFAGRQESYPGPNVGEGPPHARFAVDDRQVPLWTVDGVAADRAVYAGEAAGRWLWVIVHPAESSAIVVEPIHLVDARRLGAELTMLPLGELSPRLLIP